jgi:hypothetical protein
VRDSSNSIPNSTIGNDTQESTPPGVMAVTMLLLIISFLFTTIMMAHYSTGRQDDTGNNHLSMAKLLDIGKTISSKQKITEANTKKQTHEIRKILTGGDEKKIKWPVFLNQKIGKVTVVEILNYGVVVEYMGEQRTLTVDTTN